MNSSEQLKALIRNKSKTLNLNANIILRSIIFEFFLEKLSLSNYSDRFIIKGGFLVSTMTQINLRSTMDLDITLKSISLSKSELEIVIKDIISIPTNESLIMNLVSIEEIRDTAEYPGFRVSLQVKFDNITELMKIDFTIGDILTPNEVNFNYKTMFENKILYLKSYNIETLLAEKLETIFSRGILNTRMRDYYDVFILFHLKDSEIDFNLLKQAFENTSKSRNTYNQISDNIKSVLDSINNDQNLETMWKIYQQKYPFAKDIEWDNILNNLTRITNLLVFKI